MVLVKDQNRKICLRACETFAYPSYGEKIVVFKTFFFQYSGFVTFGDTNSSQNKKPTIIVLPAPEHVEMVLGILSDKKINMSNVKSWMCLL